MTDKTTGASSERDLMAADIAQVDAIMGFEGFEKTADVAALDAAVQAGRITRAESTQFLVLAARLTGAQSVMKAIGPDDMRHAQIARHYAANLDKLREIAGRCGPDVVAAFGLGS